MFIADTAPETLARRVNAAFATAAERLAALQAEQESPEALGGVAREAAHEFNNLLSVLQGSVELLRSPSLPADRRERYLAAIETTAERAARVNVRILALARRLAPRRDAIDLTQRLAAQNLAGAAGSAGSATPVWIEADRGELDRALAALPELCACPGTGAETLALDLAALDTHTPPLARLCVMPRAGGVEAARALLQRLLAQLDAGGGAPEPVTALLDFVNRQRGALRAEWRPPQGAALVLDLPLGQGPG